LKKNIIEITLNQTIDDYINLGMEKFPFFALAFCLLLTKKKMEIIFARGSSHGRVVLCDGEKEVAEIIAVKKKRLKVVTDGRGRMDEEIERKSRRKR
jgi:hypothetical protein